jgi:hypothetical protein
MKRSEPRECPGTPGLKRISSLKLHLKFVGKRAAQPPLGLMTVACCGKTGQDCTVRLSKALRQSKMAAKAGNSERDRDSRIAAALPAAHA